MWPGWIASLNLNYFIAKVLILMGALTLLTNKESSLSLRNNETLFLPTNYWLKSRRGINDRNS